MSRTQTRPLTMAGIVKDLARQVRERGGGQAAALAVFGRFLEQDATSLFAVTNDAVVAEGRLWELLQRELDADRRHRRGMFFTPRPLVQFIVRSVQSRLRRLAPPSRLHVIDPAYGYGAFLIEALRHVAASRFTGFEVDGPTCEVARLLANRERLSQQPEIVHANPLLAGQSLEEAIVGTPHEPLIPVIVGNPPWSNFGRQNCGAWIDGLIADYRTGLGERKSNLADDSIKFLRWAQYWVQRSGAGIVGLVTPNTWLTGLTHRRMRESLLATFDEMEVLDLHGQPGEVEDENVFGVRSGVAVVLGVRLAERSGERRSSHSAKCRAVSLRGSREAKFAALEANTFDALALSSLEPAAPDWLLAAPHRRRGSTSATAADYGCFWPLNRIFQHYASGVQTKNDAVFVGFTREELVEQVRAWLARQDDPPEFDESFIQPYLLAPFDRRWVYYDRQLLGRARYAVMRHMLAPNLGLVFMRQSTSRGEYDHFLAVDCLVSDRVFYSRHGAPFLAPLSIHKAPTSGWGDLDTGFGIHGSGTEANFNLDFVAAVTAAIEAPSDPRALFAYIYAVAHCGGYRRNFAAELRRGFPRIPLPANWEAFRRFCDLGNRLVSLHVGAVLAVDEANVSDGFRIGGYDVLKRWTKPRRWRGLSADDERELDRLAWIGRETQRLMCAIDQVAAEESWGLPQPPPPGVSTVSTSPI